MSVEPRPLEDIDEGGRVNVFRVLPGLGDMLCLVPALRSVRLGAPRATVRLVGLPSASWLPERFPDLVDEWTPVDYWPGVPEASGPASTWPAARAEWSAAKPRLALQLHGSGRTTNAPLLALAAASHAGHHPAGVSAPGRWFRPWPEQGHEARRLLGLVQWLGGAPCSDVLDFPVLAEDEDVLRTEIGAAERYACVHPGASRQDRRWSAGGFAQVADALARRGLRVFLTGTGGEVDLVSDVARRMEQPAEIVAGRFDLGPMAALLRHAEVVVSNDTGVAHLAAAVDARSVVVFTTSDIDRWAPMPSPRRRRVRSATGVPSPRQVLVEVDHLLGNTLHPRS